MPFFFSNLVHLGQISIHLLVHLGQISIHLELHACTNPFNFESEHQKQARRHSVVC